MVFMYASNSCLRFSVMTSERAAYSYGVSPCVNNLRFREREQNAPRTCFSPSVRFFQSAAPAAGVFFVSWRNSEYGPMRLGGTFRTGAHESHH